MPIIIDGWNFIRNDRSDIQDNGHDSLDSAKRLLFYLNDFQRCHNDPITIVFDSSCEYLDMKYDNTPKLRVVAARDADGYIKKFIDDTPERQRRNLRVVSSDNDVYFYAKSSYATPVKCEDFWRKLRNANM